MSTVHSRKSRLIVCSGFQRIREKLYAKPSREGIILYLTDDERWLLAHIVKYDISYSPNQQFVQALVPILHKLGESGTGFAQQPAKNHKNQPFLGSKLNFW